MTTSVQPPPMKAKTPTEQQNELLKRIADALEKLVDVLHQLRGTIRNI